MTFSILFVAYFFDTIRHLIEADFNFIAEIVEALFQARNRKFKAALPHEFVTRPDLDLIQLGREIAILPVEFSPKADLHPDSFQVTPTADVRRANASA